MKRWSFVKRAKFQSLEAGIFTPDTSIIHWMILVVTQLIWLIRTTVIASSLMEE